MLRRLLANLAVVLSTLLVMLLLAEFLVPHLVTLRDVGASFTQYDPIVGKRLKPSFSVVRTSPEFTWRFATNSLGHRGDEPKGPIDRPILFLGDSFTMGYGVSNGEEFPALIGAELRMRHGERAPYVMNLGIGNIGNGAWIRHLDHTAPPLNPRLVVMEVLQNDFTDNLSERLYELDASGKLVELPVPPPSRLRKVQQFIEQVPWIANSNLLALTRQTVVTTAGAGFGGGQQPVVAPVNAKDFDELRLMPGDPLTVKIVETAVRRCQAKGWPVLVLSVGLSQARREAIAQMVKATGAPLLELPSQLSRPDLYFTIDGHWNVKGQADTARRVMAAIDELKLLKID